MGSKLLAVTDFGDLAFYFGFYPQTNVADDERCSPLMAYNQYKAIYILIKTLNNCGLS